MDIVCEASLFSRVKARVLNVPIFYKILIANSLLIIVGAIGGTWLTKIFVQQPNFALIGFFALVGVTLSIIINFVVLKTALRPLSTLQGTVEEVYRGNTQVRVPLNRIDDPDLARLAVALNTMLDRLQTHTETIEAHQRQLRFLSGQVINAQEEERKRIARELHDETSQALATLIINLEVLEENLPQGLKGAKEKLAATRGLATRTLGDVRKLVFDLRPTVLDDLGLVPALRWYAKNHLEKRGVRVQLETRGFVERLMPQVETVLFRITQEAMNNVVKHAEARNVKVRLGREDAKLTLMVEDDGRGFNVEEVLKRSDKETRLGLFGIEERTALLGGTFTIESKVGQGTRLRVSIPYGQGEVDG
ncbi:MAG: histidine kinase [Anaerolineae bacterium]